MLQTNMKQLDQLVGGDIETDCSYQVIINFSCDTLPCQYITILELPLLQYTELQLPLGQSLSATILKDDI